MANLNHNAQEIYTKSYRFCAVKTACKSSSFSVSLIWCMVMPNHLSICMKHSLWDSKSSALWACCRNTWNFIDVQYSCTFRSNLWDIPLELFLRGDCRIPKLEHPQLLTCMQSLPVCMYSEQIIKLEIEWSSMDQNCRKKENTCHPFNSGPHPVRFDSNAEKSIFFILIILLQ